MASRAVGGACVGRALGARMFDTNVCSSIERPYCVARETVNATPPRCDSARHQRYDARVVFDQRSHPCSVRTGTSPSLLPQHSPSRWHCRAVQSRSPLQAGQEPPSGERPESPFGAGRTEAVRQGDHEGRQVGPGRLHRPPPQGEGLLRDPRSSELGKEFLWVTQIAKTTLGAGYGGQAAGNTRGPVGAPRQPRAAAQRCRTTSSPTRRSRSRRPSRPRTSTRS